MDKKLLKIAAVGSAENLSALARFLRQVEYNGNIGHTSTLHLWVDGDGAGQIRFTFPDTVGEIEPIDIKNEPKDGHKFYLD